MTNRTLSWTERKERRRLAFFSSDDDFEKVILWNDDVNKCLLGMFNYVKFLRNKGMSPGNIYGLDEEDLEWAFYKCDELGFIERFIEEENNGCIINSVSDFRRIFKRRFNWQKSQYNYEKFMAYAPVKRDSSYIEVCRMFITEEDLNGYKKNRYSEKPNPILIEEFQYMLYRLTSYLFKYRDDYLFDKPIPRNYFMAMKNEYRNVVYKATGKIRRIYPHKLAYIFKSLSKHRLIEYKINRGKANVYSIGPKNPFYLKLF